MMVRIHTSKTVAEAESYYIKGASKEAYYSEGQEFAGFWFGKTAPQLGLSGRVDEQSFTRLCNNFHPQTGEQLTPRMKSNRRPGYDFNFNCPKSVSLAYAWTKDERILQAFRQAIRDTLEEMEMMAATRVRSGGRDEDRITGNFVGGEFIHFTARPENGIPDPHLHAHCYIFNVTFDEAEGKFKALQVGDIKDHADYFNGMVTMRLATYLKELGLEIVSSEKSFEIAGIERDLVEIFSRRTAKIEATAERLGITDPVAKAKLAALTRENKTKDLLIPDLEPLWWGGLAPQHREALDRVETLLQRSRTQEVIQAMVPERVKGDPTSSGSGKTSGKLGQESRASMLNGDHRGSLNWKTRPRPFVRRIVEPTEYDHRAVAFAIEHIFERSSIVTEKQLIGEAFKSWCVGKATVEGIRQVVAEAPLIRSCKDGKTYVTTKEVLAEEDRLIGGCLMGKFRHPAINPDWQIENKMLNEQQRAAVQHVLRSEDWIMGISGKSGVGKTTLLHELRQGVEADMRKFIVLAPTSEAARDTLRKDGFDNAETVAKFLVSEKFQNDARGAVLCVDEAGLLSNRQADRLLRVAEKIGARIVLVGDVGQHHAVERGQAFDLMQRLGRMSVATVDEIQRQRGDYKQLVEKAIRRDWEGVFSSLDKMNAIFEGTLEERQKLLADDYVKAIKEGKTVGVVAPTHKEREMVTEGIREALKEEGMLRESVNWDTLRNLSWSAAQKRDPEHYKPGLVVQINRHVERFAVGEQLEVVRVNKDEVQVMRGDRRVKLPIWEPGAFSVYERKTLEIREGDTLRVTVNGRCEEKRQLHNGKTYKVDYIGYDGAIVLENGYRLNKGFKHLDYGYVTTSHGAQGKTVDVVLVAQSMELSAPASNGRQFYVSISRGRDSVKVYTDDIELLKEHVSRMKERPMAVEIMQQAGRKTTRDQRTNRAADSLGTRAPNQTEDHDARIDGVEPQSKITPERKERTAERLGMEKEIAAEVSITSEQERALEEEMEMW